MNKDNQMPGSIPSGLTVSAVKRIHGRAVLSLSNGEMLSMPRAMLKERPYRSGMPFDSEAFCIFVTQRSYPFAMEKAIALLAGRARTEKEIVDALKRNAYPEQTIARVMQRLREAGYIDDADFAQQWSATRAAKGLGQRRIELELRQKGVQQDAIESAMASVDPEDLMNGALAAAQKAARGKDLSLPSDRQKVLAVLARRGYDFSTAKQAVQTILEQS